MSALKTRVLSTAMAVVASGTLTLGTVGADLIQSSEGLRYKVYRDPVGILTVCRGHTSPYLRLGQTYTEDECDLLFKSDVIKHQVVIQPGNSQNCIRNVSLTPNQSDAVTSLVFNLGTTKFCRTTMARKLAAKDYAGAAGEFPKFKFAGGRVLPGLVTRRAREQSLFLSYSPWQDWELADLVVMGSTKAEANR